jgi:RNA recognition motif-containing protein
MRTLYVGGLTADATVEQLRLTFSRFGKLRAARIVMKPSTGKCRGFGYVTFARELEASAAMVELNGHVIDGSRWRVDMAT